MDKSEIVQILIDLVGKIQEMSGRAEVPVDLETKPVLDLPDFDSLNGVEVTVEVMDKLKVDLDFNNVLVDEGKALTIGQAASRLLDALPAQVP